MSNIKTWQERMDSHVIGPYPGERDCMWAEIKDLRAALEKAEQERDTLQAIILKAAGERLELLEELDRINTASRKHVSERHELQAKLSERDTMISQDRMIIDAAAADVDALEAKLAALEVAK